MDLLVYASGEARWGQARLRCALGRSGISAGKREGDGATPVGAWPMRRVLYRADLLSPPQTRLPTSAIQSADGWCDDPADPAYNQPVTLPYRASAESLWREDAVYDVIVILGYNDAPVIPGRGSAVFLHLARPDYAPTQGCVALPLADLLHVLAEADRGSHVVVHPPETAPG
jgi:L,D-peptidoglycan transpeptidase YkuD (ErfK/YbiS/YcfS/YnhG family)